jgi:hypothetical protein
MSSHSMRDISRSLTEGDDTAGHTQTSPSESYTMNKKPGPDGWTIAYTRISVSSLLAPNIDVTQTGTEDVPEDNDTISGPYTDSSSDKHPKRQSQKLGPPVFMDGISSWHVQSGPTVAYQTKNTISPQGASESTQTNRVCKAKAKGGRAYSGLIHGFSARSH